MLITKILFLILIIICIFFYILYVWDFALILLVVIASLPVIMFVSLLIAKFMIKVDFVLRDSTAAKGENFPVQLSVANRSPFPIGKAEATIEYYNVFHNEINTFQLFLPVQPLNTQRVTFQLSSKFCGIIKIKCTKISIYDPLRIFRFKVGKNIATEVTILPEGHEIQGMVVPSGRICEDSSTFSQHKPGDDPSEVFDLRDYAPGDKLNRIHWKLSSKKDELIVKDYSLPIDVPCMIFIDLKCYNDSEYTLPYYDTLIESMVSVSQLLIESERRHMVTYFSGRERKFVTASVNVLEDLAALSLDMINSIADNLSCELPHQYFASEPALSLASFTYITSKAETQPMSYINDELDADIKNVIAVVRESDSEELAGLDKFAGINVIPVVIGKISSTIKDIEL